LKGIFIEKINGKIRWNLSNGMRKDGKKRVFLERFGRQKKEKRTYYTFVNI